MILYSIFRLYVSILSYYIPSLFLSLAQDVDCPTAGPGIIGAAQGAPIFVAIHHMWCSSHFFSRPGTVPCKNAHAKVSPVVHRIAHDHVTPSCRDSHGSL